MPARNTELRVGRLVNDLAEVSLWETEGSGKPDLPRLSHCKHSWQTIVVHNTKKQEFLGSSVWASGSRDFESPDTSYLLISVRSCRERWLRSIPTPGRDRAFDFSPCFFQWAPPWAPAAEGTGHREDTPPELCLFFFFSLVSWKFCVIARRSIRVEHGPSEETHREERLPWSQKTEMPSGEPREAVGKVTEAADGLGGSPDGAPASHVPEGPTTTGPSLLSHLDPLTQASQTHRNFACANRKGSSSSGVKGPLQKEEHRQEGQTC